MKTKSLFTFALLCAVAQGAWAQTSGESISYIDRQWDAVNKTVVETERTISTYTEITGQVRAFNLNFGDDANGIADAIANSTLNQWYTLDGRRLTGKPTARGLYFRSTSGRLQGKNNGKKVIIK